MPARDYAAIAERVVPVRSRDARMRAVVDALWEALRERGVSWVGFYLDRPGEPDDRRLVLGPHRDKPACSPIGLHGVCGQALVSGRTRIVRDVAELGAAYVACDPRDRSEIVVPIASDGDGDRCDAVLDLDSHEVGAFDARDAAGLRRVLEAAGLPVVSSDHPALGEGDETVTIESVSTEWEASLLAASLRERGIAAEVAGAITSGFRAEAPGLVRVIVRRAEAERAAAELLRVRAEAAEIDWSQVDVGGEGKTRDASE